MARRGTSEIINEIIEIADKNLSLYLSMMDYAEEVFFDDEPYQKAQKLCIASKSDIYRSLRIVGVDHESALRTIDAAVTNRSSIRAELKSSISF